MHCFSLALALALAAETVGAVSGQDAQDEIRWHDPVALQADLDSRSPRELLEFAVQVGRVITQRVLTPDPALVEGLRSLLELPDTGVARLLDRTTSANLRSTILTRGHCAYYSFATRLHSYDAEPDLELQSGHFSGGFYGAAFGLLLEIGPKNLETLPTIEGEAPPEWLTADQAEAWPALWQSIAPEDARTLKSGKSLRRSLSPSRTSSTFLLRSYSPGEHDHLTAFRVLEQDAEGCTIAWRKLKTWIMSDQRGRPRRTGEFENITPASTALVAWLEELTRDGLLTLLDDIRATAEPKLMGVPEGLSGGYEEIVGETGWGARKRGIARILHRGEWDALLVIRGGGCYYSFFEGTNEYGGSSELELQNGSYSSGFAGNNKGLLVDIGELDEEQLKTVVAGGVPEDLLQPERELWDRLLTVRAVAENGRRQLPAEDRQWIRDQRLDRSIPAVLGHTYLLRSVLFDSHDHLVVFTVIDADEAGHTLAWKILKTWPVR